MENIVNLDTVLNEPNKLISPYGSEYLATPLRQWVPSESDLLISGSTQAYRAIDSAESPPRRSPLGTSSAIQVVSRGTIRSCPCGICN